MAAAAAAAQPTSQTTSQVSAKAALAADYGKLPLSFEANQGQVDPQVRFTSRGHGYSLFLTDKEAVLALSRKSGQRASETLPLKPKEGLNGAPGRSRAKDALKTDVVRMQLAGASDGLKVEGEEKLPGMANYFIGRDPAKWHADVPTYSKVKYAGVYPGVDLVYYGNQRQLEYDFVVAPGADPRQVKLHFAGAERLKLNSDGDLMVIAKDGEIVFHKPVVYQVKAGQVEAGQRVGESAGQRELVEGKFTLLAKNTVGFTLGGYDKSRAVIIDPTLAYSTYLGGTGGYPDGATGIAVDGAGSAYVTGYARSLDFPVTADAFQKTNHSEGGYVGEGSNAFITKLNPSGTALIYSTYLGGSGDATFGASDEGTGIAVDQAGNAYVTGQTDSKDFPVTSDAFQPVMPSKDYPFYASAFVTKLNPSGTALVYSTYLGGEGGADVATGIAIDAAGNAYVTGNTASTNFPVTAGAFQSTSRGAFVSKFNASGTALIYSTYLGGNSGDGAYAIAVDTSGNAYVAGYTYGVDFPVTAGVVQPTYSGSGGPDAFVTKLNPAGTALVYSTYLGGNAQPSDGQSATGIAVDGSGNAYVAGYSSTFDFPTTKDAFQRTNHSTIGGFPNGFLTKLNPAGTEFVYSTYLGGSNLEFGDPGPGAVYFFDQINGVAVNSSGNAFVTGAVSSTDFPVTPDAFQPTSLGLNGAFLTEFNTSGTGLVYSTYLGDGEAFYTGGYAIAVALSGDAYLAGNTASSLFPVTPGAFQTKISGEIAFISKFSFATPPTSGINFDKGFAGASGLQLNGTSTISGSRLRLTDGGKFEAASAFYATPVNVQSFVTDFTFQLTDPNADGITFTLQNNSPSVLGDFGGALGYAPIGASVAIKFDLHNNAGEGINSTGLYLSGAEPTYPGNIDLTGTGIDLHSGHIFNGYLSYDGTNLILTINDLQTKAAFTRFFPINIPSVVGGNTAYAGFTAGTGAETATQEILSWGFVAGAP